MKVGVVTARMASGERGGAEAFYDGLIDALKRAGHDASEVPVHVDETTFDAVLESYARCYALDLRDYDLVISTKAPTFMVFHPNHVSYLLHTMRVFYDMFETEYGSGTRNQNAQRRAIHALDRFGLRPGRVRRHFSNGHTTYRRLFDASAWWKGVEFRALHHPPALSGFKKPGAQDYILVPGRLHRWKRVRLIIDAYKHVKRNVPLLVTGSGEDEPAIRAAAKGDPRIRFLGDINGKALIDLYADALLVPFVPRHEDYGLVTIEAFKSGKPVLTCSDSGEPLEFVRDGHNGFVSPPNARAIAERLTYAIDHRRQAARMGTHGAKTVAHVAWEPIVDALVGQQRGERGRRRPRTRRSSNRQETFAVAVVDMQPIDPPIGGGRLRLLGLYHNLGSALPTTYVGTYDWPGEPFRRHRLSETLEEIDVPLSDAHFAAAANWTERAGGKTIIDSAFSHLAHHSSAYVAAVRQAVGGADIVVFSHPWVFPLVKDLLRQRPQLVVYDSQNVEAILRHTLLSDNPFGAEVAKHVAVVERDLCSYADLVLACSQQDRRLFHELYGVSFDKCVVVPNGTFTDRVVPASPERRVEARRVLDLPPAGPIAIFVGSLYPPNVEAARFVNSTLAPQLPDVTFVVCGGVGEALAAAEIASNVRVTMTVPEARKQQFLEAADIAVNPMFSGSGTNIKMFEFMAAGLPIVTTAIGARGCEGLDAAFAIASEHTFASTMRDVLTDRRRASSMGEQGRRLVSERYSWERISPSLGQLLRRHRTHIGHPKPLVSVIVPTYERHEALEPLMECLASQTLQDFEVIVVDQSAAAWRRETPPFDLLYVHTDIKGAARARNTGAFYARGDLLAFTDDDCRPDRDWLENGVRYFREPTVVGVEGLIISDRAHDQRYRPVTNVGFEGVGFMTANLWVRRETFHAVDGFDARFDDPSPFREDTDLAWRALEHGTIPFGADVRVYHPPQPRAIAREGHVARNRFFENDALLLKKHPERYRALFLRERHFAQTPGFFDHLQRGATKYGVQIDDFYLSHQQKARTEGRP